MIDLALSYLSVLFILKFCPAPFYYILIELTGYSWIQTQCKSTNYTIYHISNSLEYQMWNSRRVVTKGSSTLNYGWVGSLSTGISSTESCITVQVGATLKSMQFVHPHTLSAVICFMLLTYTFLIEEMGVSMLLFWKHITHFSMRLNPPPPPLTADTEQSRDYSIDPSDWLFSWWWSEWPISRIGPSKK